MEIMTERRKQYKIIKYSKKKKINEGLSYSRAGNAEIFILLKIKKKEIAFLFVF